MTIFDAEGKRKTIPEKQEADVWTPLPHNPSVEVNQNGVYRTIDFDKPFIPAPIKPDDYYGYEGWGLFPEEG